MIHLRQNQVFIVDNDSVIRSCFEYVINISAGFVVVGSFKSVEEAIATVGRNKPDIILMDIDFPGLNGIQSIHRIKTTFPRAELVIVSIRDDRKMVVDALKAGATGYIKKSANYLEIVNALEEIRRGGAPISGNIAKMIVQSFHLNPAGPLTRREKEILTLFSEGKTYSEISAQLFISKETTKTHVRNIYSKLQVNKKSEAINFAHLNKLI